MVISGVANNISPAIQSVLDIRRQLDDLQRQLGTGQKADVFAGLGPQSGLAVELSAQLAAVKSFDDSNTTVATRIEIAQQVLGQISSVRGAVKASTVQPGFSIDGSGQTSAQKTARSQLDQILGVLNTQVGDRFLF